LTARPLTNFYFCDFSSSAHQSAQSARPFGPSRPTTPSFLSQLESLTLAQLAYRPVQPIGPAPAHPGHLLPLAKPRHRLAPLADAAAACAAVGQPSPLMSRWIEAPPDRLPSPLINLAPRRLLSLLHSSKQPVLNFRHHRSVASSNPSPHRPDAIKGAQSHGHFTRSVLPHLALLIRASSRPTISTDAVFHPPLMPASFLRWAAGCHPWKGSPLPYPTFPLPVVRFSLPEWPQGRPPASPSATPPVVHGVPVDRHPAVVHETMNSVYGISSRKIIWFPVNSRKFTLKPLSYLIIPIHPLFL
jgi:hypothetical protein